MQTSLFRSAFIPCMKGSLNYCEHNVANYTVYQYWYTWLQVVGVETEKVSKEKAIADIEEEKVTAIEIEVTKKKEDCTADLAKAEPALLAAQDALNTLNKVGYA